MFVFRQPARLLGVIFALLTAGQFGCVVGQPPGKGKVFYKIEPNSGNGYYLYLPEDYLKSEGARPVDRKWPLVVTFHGMRPWDSAGAQIREWQQEADRYGYVVVAPDTRVSDLLGELPIKRVSPALKKDQQSILSILDELYETLDVDPNHVLSTSWSMGGYLAHYMINRHPDRFSCLAVKQSNFSSEILDPRSVPQYRDSKIAIFYTQHDFNICRRESQQAIAWYTDKGFDTTSGIVESMGHERTPEIAAAFFAKTCGAEPKTPPAPLARIKLTSVPPDKLASAKALNGQSVPPRRQPQPRTNAAAPRRAPPPPRSSPPPPRRQAPPETFAPRALPARQSGTDARVDRRIAGTVPPRRQSEIEPIQGPARVSELLNARPAGGVPRAGGGDFQDVPARSLTAPNARALRSDGRAAPKRRFGDLANNPLNIQVSSHIGIRPMLLSYTVQMPPEIRKGADVLWIDNGQPISRGISGQKTLTQAGQHKIEVLVVGPDKREYRTSKTVTVLERLPVDE